jgi:hypothetical protein
VTNETWIGCDLVNDAQTSLIAFPSPTINMPMTYLVELVLGIQVSFGERCDDLQLESGEINLFEAEQLARLTSSRYGISEERMKKRRREMLRIHLQLGESGARLKARVGALLYYYEHPEAIFQPAPETVRHSPEILAAAEQLEAEIEALHENPESLIAGISPDHFFYEYLQIITSMMLEIRPDEISDVEMERVMTFSEQLIHQLNGIHKRQNAPADAKTMEEVKKGFHI